MSPYTAAVTQTAGATKTTARLIPRRASGYAASMAAVVPAASAARPISVFASRSIPATIPARKNSDVRRLSSAAIEIASAINPSTVPCSALNE